MPGNFLLFCPFQSVTHFSPFSSYMFLSRFSPARRGAAHEIAAELLTRPRCQEETHAPTAGSYLPLSKSRRGGESSTRFRGCLAARFASAIRAARKFEAMPPLLIRIGVFTGFRRVPSSPTMLELALYILHTTRDSGTAAPPGFRCSVLPAGTQNLIARII